MSVINQKEYLKKYLSKNPDKPKKKKLKKKDKIAPRVRIIDDDADFQTFNEAAQEDLLAANEDAPQVVGIIDERPVELRMDDFKKEDVWKPVQTIKIENDSDNEDETIRSSQRSDYSEDDKSPPRRRKIQDLSPLRNDDNSPPRKIKREINSPRNRNGDDFSPPRRKRDVDNSPPRKRNNWSESPPRRKRNHTESPPRKIRKDENSPRNRDGDSNPPRRKRNDDISPPRKKSNDDNSPHRRKRNDDDNSPPRKRRNDDNSPPRKKVNDDNSPPRRKRNDDISPPRRRVKQEADSPPRRKNNEDNSPPRRNTKMEHNSPPRRNKNDDYSPPRRNRRTDNSPPRRNTRTDESPPRRNRKTDDTSPRRRNDNNRRDNYNNLSSRRNKSPVGRSNACSPTRKKSKYEVSPPKDLQAMKSNRNERDKSPTRSEKKSRWGEPSSTKMTKTLDGKSAGLQNAKDLVEETQKLKKREEDLFRSMAPDVSGVNSQTIIRDRKTGKIRNLEEERAFQEQKSKEQAQIKEKYDKWGKGTKQVEEYNEKLKQDVYEMNKPLARYADDEDLERYLKEQEREGDPMLAYIKKKKKKEDVDSGKPMRPQYEGEFMPNRFGIRPGHKWDGVDRSNGYEKKWFEVQNSKQAEREEAYRWNTEDM